MKEKKDLFRWFDFDVYGEKGSKPNQEIAKKLNSTYEALFKILGEATEKDIHYEQILEYANIKSKTYCVIMRGFYFIVNIISSPFLSFLDRIMKKKERK